jgi:uncharacterized protein YndB with AHSA1/START domain
MKSENEQHGNFSGPAEVRFVRTLPGPIERVWEYLTDSEKRARWFAGGPMELRQGGTVTLHVRHKNLAPDETPPEEHKASHDSGRTVSGTVTRCEPPHVLAFTFDHYGRSEATFELTTQGKNVRLVLTHRGTGEDLSYMVGFASGWHTHLAHLVALLEDAPRPPFWPLQAKFKAHYEKLHVATHPRLSPTDPSLKS